MKPRELAETLSYMIPARLPVLIVGAPGIGKSDLVAQAALRTHYTLIISHPVVNDPTDAKGLPWPDREGQSARFLPFGDLARALAAVDPTVWFLDDLGQATPAVQASYMQLLLARRIGDHVLPDCVSFVAASNRRTDRAGVSGLLEPVKSRFTAILDLDPDLDDWTEWALANQVRPELLAFLRFRPDLLHNFSPSLDLVNSPCPRTWHACNQLLTLGLPAHLEFPALCGAIGEGAAAEFVGFLRTFRELPPLDSIILNPDTASIPESPSALYAVAAGLAHKTTYATLSQVAKYAERLYKAGHGEFAVLLMRDITKRDQSICSTSTFIRLASSKIGKLIRGEE